jgi:hypothetical protein
MKTPHLPYPAVMAASAASGFRVADGTVFALNPSGIAGRTCSLTFFGFMRFAG